MRYSMIAAALILSAAPAFAQTATTAQSAATPDAGALPNTADTGARSPAERATLAGTLVHLWPYIWPSDRADLKMRVVWSVVLLVIAKVASASCAGDNALLFPDHGNAIGNNVGFRRVSPVAIQ